MKHGWHETIHDTAFHHETPFNVAVIVEQSSNHINVLREQVNREKSACSMKIIALSEGKMCKSRMRARAKQHEPCVSYDANANKERKEMNEDKWVKPRNCMPTKCFLNHMKT